MKLTPLLLLLTGALMAVLAPGVEARDQPNILIFLIDDAGNSKISSYAVDYAGYAAAAANLPNTSRIDDLAASGLRFSRFWANPNCSPTRASLQTGRMPYVHQIGYPLVAGDDDLDVKAHRMLADSFQDAGYETGLFGKWHLGVHDAAGIAGPPTTSPFWVAPHPGLAGWKRFFGKLEADIGNYKSWNRIGWLGSSFTGYTGVETTHATTLTAQVALSWINSRVGPFLAVVAFHAPHGASGAAGWVYADADATKTRTQRYADCINGVVLNCDIARVTYAALLEHVDIEIERVLNGMDPAVLDKTLIVVMGDNGTPNQVQEGAFDAPNRGKSTAYETGVRAPLIITDGKTWRTGAPGAIAFPGTVIRMGAHAVDLYQTLHDYALGSTISPSEGVSFTDCFGTNDLYCNRGSRQYGYAETFIDGAGNPTFGQVAVRYGHDKMVAKYDASNACFDLEFYDTLNDQFETNQLSWPSGNVRGDRLRDYFDSIHNSGGLTTWATGIPFC